MDWRNYQTDLGRFFNIDALSEQAPDWSPYRAFFNNPIIYSDPSGLYEDDYKLNKDGVIELIRETDDDTDKLFSTNEDGTVNEEEFVEIEDQSILPELAEQEPGGRMGMMSLATSESRDDMFSLFLFTSNNSTSEWGLNHHKTGGLDQYTLGTFFDPEQSPGYGTMGIELDNVISHVHSHPDPGVSENESMGVWESGPHGDWAKEIRRYRKNGDKQAYYNAVYFPKSGNLYNIQAAKGPVFIRKIKNNPKRFNYGNL